MERARGADALPLEERVTRMVEAEKFDAIVIGAGQGGGPLATALAEAGRKTALIERKHAGGTCVNVGCTPTKTMVASARVAYLARRAADYGVRAGQVTVDMPAVRQRKRDMVESFRSGSERRIEKTEGLAYLLGQASFSGPKTLEVRLNDGGVRRLSAGELIFINTGARPLTPQLPGLERIAALDSTSDHGARRRARAPAGARRRLRGGGVRPDVPALRQPGHDGPARRPVAGPRGSGRGRRSGRASCGRTGSRSCWRPAPTPSSRPRRGGVRMHVSAPAGERVLAGSHLLVAVGRAPNTDDLNLAAAGIETDKHGYIPVNDRLETAVPGIYALGDVKGGPAFTHISYDDYRDPESQRAGGRQRQHRTGRMVPYVVFMDPQLGRIGLSEQAARQQGRGIKVAKMPMKNVARALETDEPRGFMKAVVDAETDQMLGAAVLGAEGGEIMSLLQVAMMGHLPYTALRDATFAHPTFAEALNNLFARLE